MDDQSKCPSQPRLYRTILADPPWDTLQAGSRGANRHYPFMTAQAISDLRVGRLCAQDCRLWLWVTNASLHIGKAVMEVWGFTYRSCLTWIKPRFGLGMYLRNQTEHLLLGTRDKAPLLFRGQGTWFYVPVQEHSHKPEEQYAIIERCSPGPHIELFARERAQDWGVWGDEVTCDVALRVTACTRYDGREERK